MKYGFNFRKNTYIPIPTESLPEWLRINRKAQGLTQKELAHKLGIHPTQISRMETGLQPISLKHLEDFCYIFNLHIFIGPIK